MNRSNSSLRSRLVLGVLPLVMAGMGVSPSSVAKENGSETIDLVLMITVDQWVGHAPSRFKDNWTKDGIRYVMDNGLYYRNAHYQHATTFTAVGHAVLGTGAPASAHGLAGNDWADRETGKRIYCVADPESEAFHGDPLGTSPKNLNATTFGDEIILGQGSRGTEAKMLSVSIKDRGAILPGGQLGDAYWYDKSSGQFTSSTYYMNEHPRWVKKWNDASHADAYRNTTWNLSDSANTYQYPEEREQERGLYGLGNAFPKRFADVGDDDFYSSLRFTPHGDRLTLDFAKTGIEAMNLGNRGVTDVVQVSLSATDYAGHSWGHFSREYEQLMRDLDRNLADFFDFIDERIGLDRVLIVIASDHGADDIPEWQKDKGLHWAGRHYPDRLMEYGNELLNEHFGVQDDFLMAFWNPSLYLDPKVLRRHGIDRIEAQNVLADAVEAYEGVHRAFTREDLERGNVPKGGIYDKVMRAFQPERSGDVIFVQEQHWYLYPREELFAAMHGSPWSYDTHVPVMMVGPGIRQEVVDREVAVSQIAPTLTQLVGVRRPSGADHPPLPEAMGSN